MLRRIVSIITLTAIVAWFGWSTWFIDVGLQSFEQNMRATGEGQGKIESAWRASRLFVEPDSYAWLFHAREIMEKQQWRIRYTHMDNVPYGREVHWSHSVSLGLIALTGVIERKLDVPRAVAIEVAGRVLMPLAGAIFFSLLYLLASRYFGAVIAALFVALLIFNHQIAWDFSGLRPDHHGFQFALGTGTWLCLLFGFWGTNYNGGGAVISSRSLCLIAGALGGLALWIGASTFLFVLFAVAIAAVLCMFVARDDDLCRADPSLWRWWYMPGVVVGLFCYLLEYAPDSYSMRLEVNHPLYALCWAGLGEFLRTLALWRKQNGTLSPALKTMTLAGILAMVVLPLLILFGPDKWYLLRHPFMYRLHHEHIVEFLSLGQSSGPRWLMDWVQLAGVGLLALPVMLWMLVERKVPQAMRVTACWTLSMALIFTLLYFWQIRWAPYAAAASIMLTLTGFFILRNKYITAVFLMAMSLHLVWGVRQWYRDNIPVSRSEKIHPMWMKALLQKNALISLRESGFPDDARLIVPLELAPPAAYYLGAQSAGSLYWENVDGLVASAGFMGDPVPGNLARKISEERGLTHVLVRPGAADAILFKNVLSGSKDERASAFSVGGALALSGVALPSWMELDQQTTSKLGTGYEVYIPSIKQWTKVQYPLLIYRIKK